MQQRRRCDIRYYVVVIQNTNTNTNTNSKSSLSSLSMQQRRRCDIRYYVMLVIGSHLSPTTCTLTIKFFVNVMFYKKNIGHKYKHLVGDK